MDFAGKSVLVTGASRGIGAAIARAFAAEGAAVTVNYLANADAAAASVVACEAAGGDAIAVQADVTEREQAFGLVEQAVDAFGKVDVLVNNAGMIAYKRREFDTETFRKVLDVNLTAAMTLSTLLRPGLGAADGSIINISSLTGFFASSGNPAYGASKAAMMQLTKTLAVAWAEDGIRVNCIAPGWIATKMTEVSQNREAINDEILRRTPLKRWGKPADIAGVTLFLASPMAAYVTGETISVDGGFSCAI